MTSSAAPAFSEEIKRLLGATHSIAESKEKITKHGKSLELNGWNIDAALRKRRKRLEAEILTILEEFQPQMKHHNWVEFIETTNAGHAVLTEHIDKLNEQMNAISIEYKKYIAFLNDIKDTKNTLDEQSETLCSALDHMKFTENYRHLTYHNDHQAHWLRSAMKWKGWK